MHAAARVNNNNRNNTHLVRSWFARVTGHAHILTATGTRADADAIASTGVWSCCSRLGPDDSACCPGTQGRLVRIIP